MNLPRQTNRNRKLIHALKTKEDARRTPFEKLADWMTKRLGSIGFLSFNALLFLGWITINLELFPGANPFDPFPFGLLTMIVSLEAIILSIFVLISQNRAEKIGEIRDEIDLQVDTIAEQEITKILKLLTRLAEKNGLDLSGDAELREMLQPTNTEEMEKTLEREIG